MAKNDIPDVVSIAAQLEQDYAERNSEIDFFRSMRDLEIQPEVPANMESEVVIAPTAPVMCERIVGLLTTDPMRLEVPPSGNSDANLRQSSKMERWTKAALDELERQADEDVRERMVEGMVVDGCCAARMLYAPGIWSGMPKRKDFDGTDAEYNKHIEEWKIGRPLPIVWTWLDPRCVYPIWSEAGLECVLEKDTRKLASIDKTKFNKWKDAKPEIWEFDKHSTPGEIEFIQYWTRDSLTYAVDGEVVHHAKHQYNRPPYIYAFGQTISTKDSQKRGRSMLFNLRGILPYRDRLLSQQGTAIRMWCWPTPVFKQGTLNMPAVDAQTGKPTPLRTIEVEPGKTISLYSDEEISFLTWVGNGPEIDKMVSRISQMIEDAGMSSVMLGNGGDMSGYGINQTIAASRVKYKPIVKHAERAIEEQIRTLWDIIEYQVKQPLSLYVGSSGRKGEWLTLGPDDLKGYRQVKVTLQPIIPTDSYSRSSMAINEMQAGLRTRRSAMEVIGIEQPDEMEQNLMVEAYKARPEVAEFITQEALKRVQFEIDKQQEQQQSMAVDEFMQIWPTLPLAAQQAIMAQQIQTGAGGMPGGAVDMGMPQGGLPQMGVAPTVGNLGAQVMSAPGSNYAAPPAPITLDQAMQAQAAQANAPQTSGAPVRKLGKQVRPSGNAQGKPSGPHKVGIE